MQIDRDGGDVLMVAGSTGLAPLRALIMDLTRWGVNPRVHLFFGGRYPCELYDLRTLWQIASHNPWLSVSPVSEFRQDPPWAADYPDVQPPRGLHVRQTGRLPEVVTQVRKLGRQTDPDLRRPRHGDRNEGSADRQRRSGRTYPARSIGRLTCTRGRIAAMVSSSR